MRARGGVLSVLAALSLTRATPALAQSEEQRAAAMSVVGLDVTSADIVAWCDAGGASSAVRPAYVAWRARHAVDDVARRLDAATLSKTRDGMGRVIAATRQKLAAMGQPATVCSQLASMWTSEQFDARRMYSAAYAAAAVADTAASATASVGSAAAHSATSGGASASAARPARAFNPQYYAPTVRPTGTVYSVSQFRPLLDSWYGTPRSHDRAREQVRQHGTMYVRGRVSKRRDSFFLDDNDGTFTSSMSVSPGIDVSAFEGQEITLQGRLDEVPSSLVFLREARVVRDPSALTPSSLPAAAGRYRLRVAIDRITAPSGRGLRPADIHGMLYRGYGATGVNGYEYREDMRLLLKDGWVYFRTDIAPTDLDIAASRRLEPQAWGRWRAVSGGYELQRQDDYGQPDGGWFRQAGRLLSTWARDTRIAGSYNASAFYGSIALGGTYSSTSYVFKSDGRYERIGFSRSSSAAMAATGPQEFSASASSSSSGSGSQSVAGGGQPGVYVGSRSSTDDGAKNRGTYRLDGMMIELRSDAGDVVRTLCLPMGADHKSLYLFGRSFSISSK
jgi:hypothetical protein